MSNAYTDAWVQPQPEPIAPPAKPTLAQLQGKQCPNCHVGVVVIDSYDPDALYEKGQWPPGKGGSDVPTEYSSGGSFHFYCPKCSYANSATLAPGALFGKAGA